MKKIGEGLQYRVFEIEGNSNRVKKIPLSNDEIAQKITIWINQRNQNPSSSSSTFTFEQKFISTLEERECSYHFMKQLTQRVPQVQTIIGNIEFFEDFVMEQDKVSILRVYINDSSLSIDFQKKIIDTFIELIFECWKYGFSDRVFNITENTGIDERGNLVQIDCGEIVHEKEDVEELIKTKRWLNSWSYTKDMEISEIKEYYTQMMDEHITKKNLDMYWNKNIKL